MDSTFVLSVSRRINHPTPLGWGSKGRCSKIGVRGRNKESQRHRAVEKDKCPGSGSIPDTSVEFELNLNCFLFDQ